MHRSTLALDDRARYVEAFHANWGSIVGYARRRSPGTDGDDLAAEAFAVAWRRWSDRPSAPDELRPWLFGIARNVLRNDRRSQSRRSRLHDRLEGDATRTPLTPDDVDDRIASVLEALATLGEHDREILTLRAWDGLEISEIALVLGCSSNAATIRLHRARRRLAVALGESAGDRPDMDGSNRTPTAFTHPEDRR